MTVSKSNGGAEEHGVEATEQPQRVDMRGRPERHVGKDYVLEVGDSPSRTFTVTVGNGVKDTNTTPKEFTAEDLLNYVAGRHRQTVEGDDGKKNSEWMIGGSFGDKPDGRTDFSIRGIDAIQYDFDAGDWTLEQLDKLMAATGLKYAIYSTWSHLQDGVKHKYRVVVLLAETYRSTGIGEDRELYARAYVAWGKQTFGDTFDPVTKNLSRLFFVASAPKSRIHLARAKVVAEGALLDFKAVCDALPPIVERAAKKPRAKFDTAERKEFDDVWKVIRGAFDAGRFALDFDDTAKGQGSKVETFCPFDKEHKTPDGEGSGKTPAVWYDAANAQHDTATVSCQHTTCKEVYKRTAGDFVFAVLADQPVDVLRDYISDDAVLAAFDAIMAAKPPTFEEMQEAFDKLAAEVTLVTAHKDAVDAQKAAAEKLDRAETAVERAAQDRKAAKRKAVKDAQKNHDDAVAAVEKAALQGGTNTDPVDALTNSLILKIAKLPEGLERETAITRLSKLTGRGLTPLQKLVRIEADKIKKAASVARTPEHEAHVIADNEVAFMGDARQRIERTKQILRNANSGDKPTLFYDAAGIVTRINTDGKRPSLQDVSTAAEWEVEIMRHVHAVDENGVEHTPMTDVRNGVSAALGLGLPNLERLVTVPVFGKNGELRHAPGYDRANKTFLVDTGMKFRAVSEAPTAEEVKQAIELLKEPLRDFPFSDAFGGDEQLPVRVDGEVDAEGHPLPNYDRGVGSRANMMAFLLQPFARNMIAGPCPAYEFGKARNGTGANFLADIYAGIFEGKQKAATTQIAADEERQKQELAAAIRDQRSLIFFDNVRHKIESASLESALGSGVVQGRILGGPSSEEHEIMATMAIAGNMLRMSVDMRRRICPVFQDAAMENPAARENITNYWKHPDLQGWVAANRANLIWACHTIIMNWVAKGRPEGSARLATFNGWAKTMGGILEAAGVNGFMTNQKAYMAQADDDGNVGMSVLDAIWRLHGDKGGLLQTGDLWSAVANTMDKTRDDYGLEIQARDEDQAIKDFGRWIKANQIVGVERAYEGSEPGVRFRLVPGAERGKNGYRIVKIGGSG